MLLAETKGHQLREIRNNEDYLTSTVFGHLRYLPPSIFWPDLLGYAVSLPYDDVEEPLSRYLEAQSAPLSQYSSLHISFWPRHRRLGVPDLILFFTDPVLRPFVLLVEVKLWAEKSGVGDRDQLRRYLEILDDLDTIDAEGTRINSRNAVTALLYLAPRESLSELLETAVLLTDAPRSTRRLFRVQWQDMVLALGGCISSAGGMHRLILSDVRDFLTSRGLEYFRGFTHIKVAKTGARDGVFYGGGKTFVGFRHAADMAPDLGDNAGYFYDAIGGSGG